jgi:hypothetical protein
MTQFNKCMSKKTQLSWTSCPMSSSWEQRIVVGCRLRPCGSLTIAPPSLTKKILSGCTALANVLKGTETVLILPVPRYVYCKCCDNIEHIENFEDRELDEEIVLGLEGVKKIMHGWAMEHDLVHELIAPTQLADPCDLGLRA